MRAIVTVPFFDTVRNNRARATIAVFSALLEQVRPPHVIVAVDNGSEDLRAVEWLQKENAPIRLVTIPEPMSVAQGVNSGWVLYEDELDAGEAVAVKYDSDMIVSDDRWLQMCLEFIEQHPDYGLVGPRLRAIAPLTKEGGATGPNYIETTFLHGAVAMRSPVMWKKVGYARNPGGRWGYQDHWDSWRCEKAGLRIAALSTVYADAIAGSSALTREHKRTLFKPGREGLERLQGEVNKGTRPLREEFDGWKE